MAENLKIVEICLICDAVECGYRVVRLANGEFAFIWGIRASLGDVLPQEAISKPTDEKGIQIYQTYKEAEAAWRDCAVALQESGSRAANELLAAIGE